MKPIRRYGIFSIFVFSMSTPLMAQSTVTWNGTTNASWSTATNWSPGLPAAGDNIVIANTTTNSTLNLDDAAHSVGSITVGTTGTRTAAFVVQTTAATSLTITGGVTANGAFTTIGPKLRGNIVVSADQTWQVTGALGSHSADSGLAVNEVASGTAGTLALNANLSKSGSGQLTFGATNVSGSGDVNVNEGSLKLNAGGSLPLTLGGTGKIIANNSATVILSKNSGTFNVSRQFQFNNTAKLETGTGANQAGTFEIPCNMEWKGIHTITNNAGTGVINYRFSGIMSGAGSFTKTGNSQLILSGTTANTISGQITVAGGELYLDKTGVIAIPGNLLVTGGVLRINKSNQITNTSTVTVTGGGIGYTTGRTQTFSALSIGSAAVSSLSGLTVTGATTITSGAHQLNSGEIFNTQSLALSNNGTLQLVGNATAPATSVVNVGAGGLTLNSGKIQYGDTASGGGNDSTSQVNLSGDVVSTGTSAFTALNQLGPRLVDLQAGTRAFSVPGGSLEIKASVQNGSLVKSGTGTLILSLPGSTADFSFTEGPVQIVSQTNAGNVTQSAGSLQMDAGGATPAKITTTGNFTTTGGSIDISANNGAITPGTLELVRYGGTLTGTPTINIPASITASRMSPVVDYGTGSNSAITLTSAAVPLSLVWSGATGGLWDNTTTSNFNSGSQKFYALDSANFDDTGINTSVVLNTAVFPASVTFNHGDVKPTYTLSGTGSISGTGKVTKSGIGTTIIATDNAYTGGTDILGGILKLGNGGLTGSLGTGTVFVDALTTLQIARSGTAVIGNLITGSGSILNTGIGTAAFTANSVDFAGDISVAAGTLQLGNGGTDGALGTSTYINIAAGANFAVKRTGSPTIANSLYGDGSATISGGSPILNGYNSFTGGLIVKDGGVVLAPADSVLGAIPASLQANAIRLNFGGLKNQASDTVTDPLRGVTITGEAYFAAGGAKSLTISGPITGTGNVFIGYDNGTVNFLDTTSNWTGILTLGSEKSGAAAATTGGNLAITSITNGGVAGQLGKASAAPENLVFNGGSLIYNGDVGSTDRGFTLQGAGTINVAASTLTVSGKITGPGSFVKTGTGTLVLTGAASDFLGTKTISGGYLTLKAANALGDTGSVLKFTGTTSSVELATNTSVAAYPVDMGAGTTGTLVAGVGTPGPGINHTLGNFTLSTVTVNVAASPDIVGGDPRVTIPNLSLTAGASGTTTLAPNKGNLTVGPVSIGVGNFAKTLSLSGTSLNSEVKGSITDGINVLSLTKFSDSIWTLSGDNSFTGNITADDGVLAITHTNALGGTAKTMTVIGDASANKIPEIRLSGGISPTISTLTISGAGAAATTGVLNNISGNNTFNITTQVNLNTGNGGTTLYSTAGTLTINTPTVRASSTGRVLTLAGPGNGVINAVIANGSTGALPLIKNDAGKWTLNGANTYTGATTVNGGVLSLNQAALSDTAALTIATGATLDLNFSGSDRVGSLTVNGVLKPDGLYSAATDPGFITGTGSIRVGAATVQGYTSWAASFPFTTGVNDGASNDPDGDGIPNLLEYVLGGVPIGAGAGNTSILPTQTLNATSLVLTFRRSDISETDVTLKVQWSADFATWTDFATIGAVDALPKVDVTEDSPSADLDTIVVTIPRSTSTTGKLFARVQAVK